MKTKKRRNKEVYEDYCKFTLEYTDFKGVKFLNLLTVTIDDIDARNGIADTDDYKDLQKKINEVNPKNAKDPTISARKSINSLIKLGFVNSKLSSYHRLAKQYLNAPTIIYKNLISSNIITESASFASSYKDGDSGVKNIDFITNTLSRIGSLSKDQITGLMIVDPKKYPDGFITENELIKKVDEVKKIDFEERKYNQISFVCNILGKIQDLEWHESKLYFKEDIRKNFQHEKDNKKYKRNGYLDACAKKLIEYENNEKTGNSHTCMVTNIIYPNLISSHIKRSEKCSLDEKYDHKNLLLLSPEIDNLFDSGNITFDEDGKILFNKNLDKNLILKLSDKKLNSDFVDPERKRFLEWHRSNWFVDNR